MLYNLSIEHEKQRFDTRVEKLKEEGATVELAHKRKPRSLSQNAYLHLVIGWFAIEYGHTIDYCKKELYKKTCNADLFVFLRTNKKTGEQRNYLRSSKELTTDQMTTSIERFRNWSAKQGIYLPAPNEEDFLEAIRIEVERNKQYL